MATTVDELQVLIRADTKGLRRDLKYLNKRLGNTHKQTQKVSLGFGTMARAFAAIGLVRVIGDVVKTSMEFEDLGATLRAVTGSAQTAAISMELITRFTAGTPFQLQNVSRAFVTLLNAGITPTTDVLQDFGNIAAAFGKDISQIAQATFNATTGEMEMLKQFGIKAKLEGDKITMIFKEKETTIGRNSDEIVGYLRNIAQENYATALEERLNTVSGAMTVLKDNISLVFKAVGEGGLNSALTETTKELIDMTAQGIEPARKAGRAIAIAFDRLKEVLGFVIQNIRSLVSAFVVYMTLKVGAITIQTAIAFNQLRKSLTTTKVAMMALNKVSKGNVLLLLGVAVASLAGGLDKVGEMVDSALEKLGQTAGDFFEDEADNIDEVRVATEELNQALIDNQDAYEGVQQKIGDDFEPAMDQMQDAVIKSSEAFTKDFVDGLLAGENALDSFKNFAKNIVSQIITIFLQMEVVNRILANVFPNLGIRYGGIITEGNAPDTSAGGGTIQPRNPVLVGERGPEIFVPNTGGTVLNNMNSKNALGGGDIIINQNLNFSTGVQSTVRSEVIKLLPTISEVTKASVMDSASRGGNFAKAIRG